MRQLSAILFADIMGYTAMMQENESYALRAREKFRKTLDREIMAHNGQVIQYSGDGALCTFNSAVSAVSAAIAVQQEMRRDPEVPLRIGIHSGDVIIDEQNIYGDGVNIASRIESFAVAGAVFISSKVYDEIRNQNNIEAVLLGTFQLKNVKQPIEIYAVSNAGLIVPPREKLEGKGEKISDRNTSPGRSINRNIVIASLLALALLAGGYFFYDNVFSGKTRITDKSIAVLPFENLSDNNEDAYFTEGMTDEILTQLSQINGLKVLSRTSTEQYRDTKKNMKQIGEELGVQSLVEGSVRKVGDQLRVIIQLINAKTDEHIWAKTYDRKVKDIFAIQSEIARQIAEELDSKLTPEEEKRITQKPTENVEAYDYYLRGRSYASDFWAGEGMRNVPLAANLFRSAFRLDPKFVDPYAYLIVLYTDVYYYHFGPESDSYLSRINGLMDTLMALKIDRPIVHVALGSYHYKIDRDYTLALAEYGKAIEQDPNNIEAPLLRAEIYRRQGKPEEALKDLLKVLERSPNEEWHLAALFETYLSMRNAEKALFYNDKLISLLPDKAVNYITKAYTIAVLEGNVEKARSVLKAAQPMFDTDKFAETNMQLDMLEGNYQPYLATLLRAPDTLVEKEVTVRSAALEIAIMYRAEGKAAEAKKYFARARDALETDLQDLPGDFRILSPLAVAYAGLGERQKALEYGKSATELAPVSEDITIGVIPLENLALIHALLGEQDEAVDILEQVMKMPFSWYSSNTIPLLKMAPRWASLKNNPKFQKLVAGS